MVSPQSQGILSRVTAPTIFRGAVRPAANFSGGTVMDLLNSLGVSEQELEELSEVLPALDAPLPEAPVEGGMGAGPLPEEYTPIEPDPEATDSGTPVVEVV